MLWALPASLALHALIAAFLVYGLPIPPQEPQEEQPINVALVPPPDPPKPKPPQKPEAKKPPEAEKPPEQKVEQPLAPPKIEGLRPVFQFGDKNAGSRKSLEGASAQDNSPAPAKDDVSKPPGEPKAESKPAAPDFGEQDGTTKAEEKPETEDASKQEADKQQPQDADKQAAVAVPLTAPGDDGEIELPASAQAPKARPENMSKPSPAKVSKPGSGGAKRLSSTDVATAGAYSGLPGVRKLFSQGATGDALVTTAINGLPREERAGQLCASVLQQELFDASFVPAFWPIVRQKVGNIINDPDAYFRTRTTWYHLSFRCEIDANATRVLSFTSRVGSPASPAESTSLEQALRRQYSGG
ncbi:DUF930 domain-containing protein [Mesorhizobium sp. PL10]